MDLRLKPKFAGPRIRRRPYAAPKEQAKEIERQIQECIDAGLVLEYKDGDYLQHCSPCFLMPKPGATAKRLVVDYAEVYEKTLNYSGSVSNMESTLEKIASCRYKMKMDTRSSFWQVALTPNAQELLAFISPQGRVFKWKVMPSCVANATALFQELMNKILSILRPRHVVQELISRDAQMEAHISDVCLGANTQEDHLILLGEFFAVCQENHPGLKLEKCEFMQETMQHLGRDIGYGWWTYLSQLPRSVQHIQGVKNECADYISCNSCDNMISARSEEVAKEALSCMDVHLDHKMTMIRPLDGLQQVEYLKAFGDIYKRMETRLEPIQVKRQQ